MLRIASAKVTHVVEEMFGILSMIHEMYQSFRIKIIVYIHMYLGMIDINDRFNVRSSIIYYNVKKLKTIYMKQKQKETILGW